MEEFGELFGAYYRGDLELLKDRYKVEEITPFDMFSSTAHVETLVLLSKN